jgi:dTDP-4-dehydrorhamnose 3,5-epimerase
VKFEIDSPCPDPAVLLVRYSQHVDDRGAFSEAYRAEGFRELGLPGEFPQDCFSRSPAGVLRGMHFQRRPLMGKLIRVSRGRAVLVARNVHPKSPYFGRAFGIELAETDCTWVWAPGWYARGYLALAPMTEVYYKCTAEYNPETDAGIAWNDPSMTVMTGHADPRLWPAVKPSLSERDRTAPTLEQAFEAGLLDFDQEPS